MTWDRAARVRQTFAFTLPLLLACGTKPPGTQADDGGGSYAANGGTSSGATSGTGPGATGGQGGSIMGQGGSGATAGSSGGGAGMGASAGAGGSAASAGAGATAGTSGAGGSAGGAAGASGAGGSGGASICQELSVIPMKQVPTVMLVVDTSSSMWETQPAAWPILHTALMDPAQGVIHALQDQVRFGFESYKGTASISGGMCAEFAKVPPAYTNLTAIETVYGAIDWPIDHPKWDTPTHHAIDTAAMDLAAYTADPPGKKYILLVTDGNPDTCEHFDPNCGQDMSIKAVQDAHAAGIDTYVLGVGDIVVNPNAGCSTKARCGLLHLQDLANAGIGADVQAPPGCADVTSPDCQFKYEQCNNHDNMNTLLSTYVETAPNTGTPYTVDTTAGNAPQTLITTLTGLLNNVISCTVEMDAKVTGDPALGSVSVGGTAVNYADPNGWSLDMTTLYNVTLEGTACETFKSGAELHISFPCDPNGNPIAVRR